MKKNIVVLFGGNSSEHDISIVSAFYVRKFLDEYLYNVDMVYINKKQELFLCKDCKNLKDFLSNKKIKRVAICDEYLYFKNKQKLKPYKLIDVVLPILHGVNGEDGTIESYLKFNNLCRVTPNLFTACVGMDKALFKKVIENLISVLPFVEVNDFNMGDIKIIESEIEKRIGYPCIIKPARQGSSIGIEICENKENLQNLLKKCLKFDKKLIIEPYLTKFREFNVAIYKTQFETKVSEIEEPFVGKNILSFEEKYLNFSGQNTTKLKKIPPKINKKLYNEIVENAKLAYQKINANGVIRFDFIYDQINKKLYLNEANTIPGSLAIYLFSPKGIGEDEVLNDLIGTACTEHFLEKTLNNDYKSDVLKLGTTGKFSK